MVFTHNHSPGFEILPNGDALAVYFSTPPGKAESRSFDFICAGAVALRRGRMGFAGVVFQNEKIQRPVRFALERPWNNPVLRRRTRDFRPDSIRDGDFNRQRRDVDAFSSTTRRAGEILRSATDHQRVSRRGRRNLFCDGWPRRAQFFVAQRR